MVCFYQIGLASVYGQNKLINLCGLAVLIPLIHRSQIVTHIFKIKDSLTQRKSAGEDRGFTVLIAHIIC